MKIRKYSKSNSSSKTKSLENRKVFDKTHCRVKDATLICVIISDGQTASQGSICSEDKEHVGLAPFCAYSYSQRHLVNSYLPESLS